jgi:hypothetical protein
VGLVGLSAAERQRRSRAHKKGDHSLCDPERCVDVTSAVTEATEPNVTETVTDPVLEQLGRRGRTLYREVLEEHQELGGRQRVLLEEAARAADRLETLDRLLHGDLFVWAHVETGAMGRRELVVDKTLAEARQQQAILARLLGELRQSLAPAASQPTTPALPVTGAAPAAASKSGGGKLVDIRARIASARAAAAR